MSDAIGLYLNEIGKVPLLNAEDERNLSKAIEKGRDATAKLAAGERGAALRADLRAAAKAKDHFIRSNLRLVVSIARRYPLPQGIGRALDQKASLIRIPGDRSATLRAALRQGSGDAEGLDSMNAELHRLTTPVSLDKTIGDDGDATLGDLVPNDDISPEEAVMSMVETDLLDNLLNTLDERARYAVEARFGMHDGERKSFRQVGEELGVTAEAARRLVSRAVDSLRDDAGDFLTV
jgi:RNA polymerase primary sigma factor